MHRRTLLKMLTLGALAAAAPARLLAAPPRGQQFAARGEDGDRSEGRGRGKRGGDQGGGKSLDQAVQQVQRDTGGRVLSAETVSQGGRGAHRIKVLLPSGQVRVITIDAGR